MTPKALKTKLYKKQNKRCGICGQEYPKNYMVIKRIETNATDYLKKYELICTCCLSRSK